MNTRHTVPYRRDIVRKLLPRGECQKERVRFLKTPVGFVIACFELVDITEIAVKNGDLTDKIGFLGMRIGEAVGDLFGD